MENLQITVEATLDLSKGLIKEYGLKVIDMEFIVGDECFSSKTDTVESSGLYQKMREGKRTGTSQVNEETYYEIFLELAKSKKFVLHLAFSSGLSGTVNNAKRAGERVNQEYPNSVFVIDSLCGCSGQGLYAMLVSEYAKKCDNVLDVIKYAESMRYKLIHSFSIDNLKYLSAGGRINPAKAFIGNLLKIKPILRCNRRGELEIIEKVISRKKSLMVLANDMVKGYDSEYKTCIISHAECREDAEFIAKIIKEKTDVTPIIENLGPILGSHSGPGAIALFYVGFDRK